MKNNLSKIRKKIIPVLKKHDVIKAGIFGSYATGEAKKNSDIDLLIQYRRKNKSLFDLIDLKFELEKKLNKKVDILTYQSINHLLRDIILNEEIRIYEERT